MEKMGNYNLKGIRLDIGVGDAPAPGYIHCDIQALPDVEIVADARKIPLDNNSVSELRSAHLIEHFPKEEIPQLLKEWYRLVEPNGTIRILVPDFVKVCRQIVNKEIPLELGLLWTYGGHRDGFDIHHWGYTFEILKYFLENAGFLNITQIPNKDGWMEVVGKKIIDNKKKISYYITHHHILGGGENYAFTALKFISDLYQNVEVVTDEWLVKPEDMGIDMPNVKRGYSNDYDIFINMSHHFLQKPKGKKNIAIVFYPQYDWKEDIKAYDRVVTISEFSQREIKRKWGIDADIIYPAIDLEKYHWDTKKKQILCVGRFFYVPDGNNKNQHHLVEAFKKMPKDWKLIFVGSVQDQEYFDKVKKASEGLNIEFKHEVPFDELVRLYSESYCLWSATGYGTKIPSSTEHFGIVAVEALASSCRALVHNSGGMCEINVVETWETLDELVKKTLEFKERQFPDLTKYSLGYAKERWFDICQHLAHWGN
jgi:glycosyltransferase involved in cell wall biosynthesis